MKKRLSQHHKLNKAGWLFYSPGTALLLMFALLAACSPKTEYVTVEVTRIVTETVTVEGESTEVTRIVTETIDILTEEETDSSSPSATGSEGDAGPLPPMPEDEPKVAESRGSAPVADFVLETAVALRANQIRSTTTTQPTLFTTSATINPTELQKWCRLAATVYKKRCAY
jgi:hypothetical protein